jgi:hypothetical protein
VNDLICFFFRKNKVNSVVECGGMCCNKVLFDKQRPLFLGVSTPGSQLELILLF